MMPELQQNTVCIGATAIPHATGVRRTEWNQTEEGEETFPPPLNHQTQTRLQLLRPPVHNPLSQTQTRLQRLRPPVHNPLSQIQTRLQRLRPPVHNPLSQTQTRLQPLRPPVHNPLSQTQTRLQPLRPPVHNPLSQTQTRLPTPETSSSQPPQPDPNLWP
uniref:pollen-specific leucine-rich repeat extensin-like protein 3 isoform X1 n=1 Tax=Oncorhynchus gorbuscha TaxID=8017 RepID=UPI001EAF4B12|nr:pollen-specific leucine-rich repeat extensin-like protein 3 isoform X1 [Oncorhynchus gorbuscha]